ncbi:accessory Sec system protein Asp2 [Mammaliicoccus sp. G-M28]|uniref:accessory Sec system protein Asp2 n=1 Tax=Mammaliicoccus sp. G-M28 TaxID=2898688 RepID=UPI001EFB6C85|nr:accessory Sec system protein Asp2 [Mammaliicoccus sp. G-M28]
MSVKIATIGSCVTRDNFNTKFNPNYKNFLQIIDHQNQTAIPSLMSNQLELNVSKEFVEKNSYVQSLLHKEFSKEFLQKLKNEQPDYLIFDLDPDVKFGLLKINENEYITNNPNFKNIPELKDATRLNLLENYDEYIEVWEKYLEIFFDFIKREIPNCEVILVKARFSDKFEDGTTLTSLRKETGIATQDFEKMNKIWNHLDDFVINNFKVSVLDMTDNDFYLDKNHLWGPYYLHYEPKFYNTFLNKLVKMISSRKNEHISLSGENRTIQRIYLNESYELLNTKVVEVVLQSDKNLIQRARRDKDIYNLYKELLKNDYILYYHSNGISRLYKREFINELWKRQDLYKQGDVFYTLDEPKEKKKNNSQNKNKLLVIFTCMPSAEKYDHYLMTDRMFPTFFNTIERSLVKNVYTMRIMDLNCSHGSHYINTINYSNMESDIVEAINRVKNELSLNDEDIVLYGASKGGTGSLYYGSKMDLQCLAVDPILSLGEYNIKDEHFLKDIRIEDITDQVNNNLYNKSKSEKYIIGSENVPFNFDKINKIEGDNLRKINKIDEHIKSHPDVSRNTVPEQLMILNQMLLNNSLIK